MIAPSFVKNPWDSPLYGVPLHLIVTVTGGRSIRWQMSSLVDVRLYIFGQTVN
jgi:hypothetical protein